MLAEWKHNSTLL